MIVNRNFIPKGVDLATDIDAYHSAPRARPPARSDLERALFATFLLTGSPMSSSASSRSNPGRFLAEHVNATSLTIPSLSRDHLIAVPRW
jgi:hypothetical protein